MLILEGYLENNTLRESFNALAGKCFGIDFEPWYGVYFCFGSALNKLLLCFLCTYCGSNKLCLLYKLSLCNSFSKDED